MNLHHYPRQSGQTLSFAKNEAAKKFRCGSRSRGNAMHFSRHDRLAATSGMGFKPSVDGAMMTPTAPLRLAPRQRM
jgi:hypothetical protein